jgi:hypothetical protein
MIPQICIFGILLKFYHLTKIKQNELDKIPFVLLFCLKIHFLLCIIYTIIFPILTILSLASYFYQILVRYFLFLCCILQKMIL